MGYLITLCFIVQVFIVIAISFNMFLIKRDIEELYKRISWISDRVHIHTDDTTVEDAYYDSTDSENNWESSSYGEASSAVISSVPGFINTRPYKTKKERK